MLKSTDHVFYASFEEALQNSKCIFDPDNIRRVNAVGPMPKMSGKNNTEESRRMMKLLYKGMAEMPHIVSSDIY